MVSSHAFPSIIFAFDWATQLPSIDDVISMLHLCCMNKDLPHAKLLHTHVCDIGLEAHHVTGNYLVPLFVDCESLDTAQQVFNGLSNANEYSWASLIKGYADAGELWRALQLYASMDENAIEPDRHIFVALLKACSLSDHVENGWKLHSDAVKEDFNDDLYIGNTLIDMYAKSGLTPEARDVLDEMPLRSVVSWTALVGAYAEHGPYEEALECLQMMEEEGVLPNEVTFVSALKACSALGFMEKGEVLHGIIVMKGFDDDLFVANTLVDMYSNCGSAFNAHGVFDQMLNRDVVSWNALISGYAKQRLAAEVLSSVQVMELEGVSPIDTTYLALLKACGIKGIVGEGHKVHMDIVKRGFESVRSIGNTLVDMYARCGAFSEAYEVLDNLEVKEEVSWNALMGGYAEQGLGEEALDHLEEMRRKGICPDIATFVRTVCLCGQLGAMDKGFTVHTELCKKGHERDPFLGNALLDMYANLGLMRECQSVFDGLLSQEIISWNALIAGYADNGFSRESMDCLEHMQMEGASFNSITFACGLKACGKLVCEERGQFLHMASVKQGLEENPVLGSSLVDMYAKCGLLVEAEIVFEQLPAPNVVSWTALIAGYASNGLCDHAFSWFWKMQTEGVPPDIASWNAILSGYGEHGEPSFVLYLYAQMLEQAQLPDMNTILSLLKACSNMVGTSVGRRFHAAWYGLEFREPAIAQAFIDMYRSCGSVVDVEAVFDAMPVKDISAWNVLISAYAHCGHFEHVFYLLERTEMEGVNHNEITLLCVLCVCSHGGLVNEGKDYFCRTITEYDILKTIKHYTCIVDLLCRVGCFLEALALIEVIPFEPDYAMWCTVLGACRTWANVKLGRLVLEHTVRSDNQPTAAFLLMYNIYADAHMWEEAKRLEEIIRDLPGLEGMKESKYQGSARQIGISK